MAARPDAMANRIADGIVEQIRNHVRDYPWLWAQQPATIGRGVGSNSDSLPVPIVLVSSNGQSTEQATRDNEFNRTHKTLTVLMLTRDAGNPEGAIEDLLADVWRAIASNRQLASIDDPNTPVLASGRIILGNSETFATSDNSGEGMATLELTVEFSRNYAAP